MTPEKREIRRLNCAIHRLREELRQLRNESAAKNDIIRVLKKELREKYGDPKTERSP